MKYISSESGYAHTLHVVQLEGEETKFTDAELITVVDNGGIDLSNKPAADAEKYIQARWSDKVGFARHFGGTVERRNGKQSDKVYARVKVYTD